MGMEDLARAMLKMAYRDCVNPTEFRYSGREAPLCTNRKGKRDEGSPVFVESGEVLPGASDDDYFEDFTPGPNEVREWVVSDMFEVWAGVAGLDAEYLRDYIFEHWGI